MTCLKFIYAGLLIMVIIESAVSDKLKTEGDVTVKGLFQIYESEAGICSTKISVPSVMAAEAVKWYFNQLYTLGKMPIKIGFEVEKTCGLPNIASERALEIVIDVLRHSSNSTTIGVIGPEYSSEAMSVSRIFSSVNEQDMIVQIGFSTTAPALRDTSAFPNFVRVIPNDIIQIEVMIQSMQAMQWNRIVILHDTDVYGRHGALMLKTRAEERGICVHALKEIKTENIYYVIHDVMNNDGITGVVYFGYSMVTSTLSIFTSSPYEFDKFPVIMLSEGNNLYPNIFKNKNGGIVNIGKGSYTVTPTYRNVAEFEEHWISIFSNKTKFASEYVTNPWLLDVYNEITSCANNECPFTPSDTNVITNFSPQQPMFTQYAVIAAHTFAKAVKIIHSKICGKVDGLCEDFSDRFRQGHVIQEIKNMYLDFTTKEFLWTPNCFKEDNVLFHINSSGELNALPSQVFYELYNFKQDNHSSYKFAKIGEFKDGQINIMLDKIRDVDASGKQVSWPSVRKGQCNIGQMCSECLLRYENVDSYLIDHGDAYVVATLPISDKSGLQDCGSVRKLNGYQLIESIRYAIKRVNTETPIMFSNMHIGLIVLNSCNNEAVIDRKIYNLHKTGVQLKNGTTYYVNDKIIGYIGDIASQVSLSVAATLTNLRQLQISIASTTTVLSDRDKYPYFMRVVPPDHVQAKAIIAVVKEMELDYVQIMYSEGAYGETGKNLVKDVAHENNICIAQELEVKETDKFVKIYQELRKKPYAKLVIVLFQSSDLTIQLDPMYNGDFTFLVSEAWGKSSLLLNKLPVGSITVSLEMKPETKLENHVLNIKPKPYNDDPWSMTYLQKKYSCYFSESFDKKENVECRNITSVYELDSWVAAAALATTSLLRGAKSLLKKRCVHPATALCHDFIADKKGLVEEIKKTSSFADDGINTKVFDDNGDGNRGYTIYQIQQDLVTGDLFYKQVGRYTLTVQFSLDIAHNVSSNCPNDAVCNECLGRSQTDSKDSDRSLEPYLIVMSVILAVCVVAIVLLSGCFVKSKRDKADLYITAVSDGNQHQIKTVQTTDSPAPCKQKYIGEQIIRERNQYSEFQETCNNPTLSESQDFDCTDSTYTEI